MQTYLAFLRGINVGGNSLVKMAELKASLEKAGLMEVKTYIQSGNVLFESDKDKKALAKLIAVVIEKDFKAKTNVAVFTKAEWQKVIKDAPKWWGQDKTFKHNILIMTEAHKNEEIYAGFGELKPDIENLEPGKGVFYQSVSWKDFGKAATGKLNTKPVYKKMTVRNFNTATKLAQLD